MSVERLGVVVLHNLPAEGPWPEADAGVLAEVDAVLAALARLKIPARAAGIRALAEIRPALAGPERIVFNLVEGLPGDPGPATNAVPLLCRLFGKAVTGNGSATLALCLDKALTKEFLRAVNIPTPEAALVPPGRPLPSRLPPGALFVKPAGTDASEGIDAGSLVSGPGPDLERALAKVHAQGCPALIERYIAGRELNVALFEEAGRIRILPPAEIDFSAFPPGKPRIVDYAAKWLPESFAFQNTPRLIPAPLPDPLAAAVVELARAAWRALGCRDYARIDFRLDEALAPFVLEANPNPDIGPEAGFAAALAAAKIPYERFIGALIGNAARRIPGASQTANASDPRPGSGIAPTRPEEREAILDLLQATGFFRLAELEVAAEVLDEVLAARPACGYRSLTALSGGRPAGWICFGPAPCSEGTFDVYWLGVHPDHQGQGLGRALMQAAEAQIRAAGGRLMLAETAGREDYRPTRRFYRSIGYREEARVADFYAPGDDKVVFVKRLEG